jgi:MauM/NapG family ferredoxin protein
MADQTPFNRRNFFRQGLKELLRPLSNAAGPLEEVIKQLSSLDLEAEAVENHNKKKNAPPAVTPPASYSLMVGTPIRPPGALPEQKFRETCSRCGECVRVCPVQAIKIDPSGVKGAGAPFIDIDSAACVLCDGLLCMNKCPSGALVPTAIGEIDMGTAVWREQTCLRMAGEYCTICIDECPIGEMAIVLEAGRVKVIEDGCTGCGVCQNRCPTSPKSIAVTPRSPSGPSSQPRGRSR